MNVGRFVITVTCAVAVGTTTQALAASTTGNRPIIERSASSSHRTCATCEAIGDALAKASISVSSAVALADSLSSTARVLPPGPCITSCGVDLSTAAGAIQFAFAITHRVTSAFPPGPCSLSCGVNGDPITHGSSAAPSNNGFHGFPFPHGFPTFP